MERKRLLHTKILREPLTSRQLPITCTCFCLENYLHPQRVMLGSQFPLREYKNPPTQEILENYSKLQFGPPRDCPENCHQKVPKNY